MSGAVSLKKELEDLVADVADDAAFNAASAGVVQTIEAPDANREELSEVERYKPTDREIAAIQRWSARKRETKTPRVSIEQTSPRSCTLSFDHEAVWIAEILLSNAIGCPDSDFRSGLIDHLVGASKQSDGTISDRLLNMGIAVVKDIKPTDAIEAMLAAQMFAIHVSTMTYAQRTAENNLVEDRAEPCLNRLARTFTTQVEALKRYRSKGEQVVRVERVYVGEGGQAIVGNVSRGRRGHFKKLENKSMNQLTALRLSNLRKAPRCQSLSRQTGKPCGNAAERGKVRCRFHGARAGAPKGNQNSLKHGRNTAAVTEERRRLRELLREVKAMCARL